MWPLWVMWRGRRRLTRWRSRGWSSSMDCIDMRNVKCEARCLFHRKSQNTYLMAGPWSFVKMVSTWKRSCAVFLTSIYDSLLYWIIVYYLAHMTFLSSQCVGRAIVFRLFWWIATALFRSLMFSTSVSGNVLKETWNSIHREISQGSTIRRGKYYHFENQSPCSTFFISITCSSLKAVAVDCLLIELQTAAEGGREDPRECAGRALGWRFVF